MVAKFVRYCQELAVSFGKSILINLLGSFTFYFLDYLKILFYEKEEEFFSSGKE